MTREQLLAERKQRERAAAIRARQAAKPEIRAHRVAGGVLLTIAHPTQDMRAIMDTHGFTLVTDIANTFERVCATPADLTVVQDALRGFFGR